MIAFRVRKRFVDDDNNDEDDDVDNDNDNDDDEDDDDDDNDDTNEEVEEEEQSVCLLSNRCDMLLRSLLSMILGILAHDGASVLPAGERCRFLLTAGVLLSTVLPGISADSPLLPQSAASAMPNI